MKKGTILAKFFGSLSKKPPSMLADLMKRAEKYIRKDDALMTSSFMKESQEKDTSRGCLRIEVENKWIGDQIEVPKP